MTTDTHKKPSSGDVGREAFERWWTSSKYTQVAYSPQATKQVAMDGFYAALRYRDELEKGDGKG